MGLFDKFNSSSPKHHLIEVIKYEGPNDILIWRHPNEDFNNNAKLIVGPSQEAIFIDGGKVLESFPSGTYTLSTKNHPFIRNLVARASGGDSPFSCVVCFINKAVSMGIDWGTDAPISVIDPIYGVPADVRSYGDFSLRVVDGRTLMEKLVGQTQGFSQDEVTAFFSNLMAARIRGVISQTMMERGLSPIGIDAHLVEMSDAAAEKIRPVFEPYGLSVEHFVIGSITAPDLESFKQKSRVLQQHRMDTDITVEDKRKMAQAQAFENQALNVTEQEKWVGSAMGTVVHNPGPVTGGSGILFPGAASVNVVRSGAAVAADMAGMLLSRDGAKDAGSGTSASQEEAAPQPPARESFEERAKKVKFLLDNGMITQEQYQEKMARLLDEI